jgi:hypothetical protein
MFKRKQSNLSDPPPEKTHYTKYYEHDGQLRAHANGSMLVAGLFGVIAFISLLFAIYVRLQPPTVIRVAADGEATVVGGRPIAGPVTAEILKVLAAAQAGEVSPTDIEGRAADRKFLESYLRYTPTSVDKNFADALNMMTQNLRVYCLNQLRDQDLIGKIKDEQITSSFKIRSIEPIPGQVMDLSGIRGEGSSPHSKQERVYRQDRWQVPCAADSGPPLGARAQRLLVAEYREEQMVGEKDIGLLQESGLLDH